MVFGCLSGLCECLEASLGLEPRLPVDRNLLYSDRVSEYREAYPVRRRIRTHQAWKQLIQRLLRHFGARARCLSGTGLVVTDLGGIRCLVE